MDSEQPSSAQPEAQNPPKKKRSKKTLWCILLVVLLLLVAAGLFWWCMQKCATEKSQLENEKKQLESKVEDLNKQLAAKSATGTSEPAEPCTTAPQSLKDNIKDAITSKNYAALEGYMTNPLKVVLAASEKGGPVTPAQAVTDLEYLEQRNGALGL